MTEERLYGIRNGIHEVHLTDDAARKLLEELLAHIDAQRETIAYLHQLDADRARAMEALEKRMEEAFPLPRVGECTTTLKRFACEEEDCNRSFYTYFGEHVTRCPYCGGKTQDYDPGDTLIYKIIDAVDNPGE